MPLARGDALRDYPAGESVQRLSQLAMGQARFAVDQGGPFAVPYGGTQTQFVEQ